ncbi:TetR/AcrR family transcriptional regulator [Acidicapsa acidisoli]|uniref:TetR/AcrR family transcriptional regulator n=1 Tax=Acidicapsa acidisoli TaxID=1615681 RepID=UPI0021E05D49|nr:TetR/AcrR family transcriptional regulator [Acidicapsa acidisoli]
MSTSKIPGKNQRDVNLTWGTKAPPSRGPKPALSPSQIARAAILVADAEGLDAVTMQRVGREVGVTTMALYRYFPGKDDLLDLMIDSASDSAANFGKQSSPWSLRLKKWARRCLSIYRNHPWFLEATSVRHRLMGPNELMWIEAVLAILAESGLSSQDQHHAFLAVIGHVRGHATFQRIAERRELEQEWIHDLAPLLRPEAHRYPALMRALDSGTFFRNPAAAFDFGLDCIVEGIRARACSQSREPDRLPSARRSRIFAPVAR